MRENRLVTATLIILGLVLLAALFAPFVTPFDPLKIDLGAIRQAPSRQHLFGTDELGRDVLSRVLFGARATLAVGLVATLFSALLGTVVGLIGGYCGKWVDALLNVVTDVTLAFPSLLLAIGIAAVMKPGLASLYLALTLTGWAGFARLTRSQVLTVCSTEYIEAGRALGASSWRLVLRQILPNCLPIILVAVSLRVGAFILNESALSFLGLGLPPPTPTWGGMVSYGRDFIRSAPWMTFFPGLALAVTILAFNVLGDFARDKLDPRLRI